MTLTLSPEEREARRQEALARIRSGYYQSSLSSSEEFMARKADEKALEDRRETIWALMGSSAHLGPSHISEDRAEEVAREEQAYQERQRK